MFIFEINSKEFTIFFTNFNFFFKWRSMFIVHELDENPSIPVLNLTKFVYIIVDIFNIHFTLKAWSEVMNLYPISKSLSLISLLLSHLYCIILSVGGFEIKKHSLKHVVNGFSSLNFQIPTS